MQIIVKLVPPAERMLLSDGKIIPFELPNLEGPGAREPDAKYLNDHFFDEPHSEPVTIKMTPTLKRELIEIAKNQGYTSLGPAIRDLILIGIKYQPLEAFRTAEDQRSKYKDHPIVRQFFFNSKDT